MDGWIKLHRKLVEWEWYDDTNTFRLFLHLLLKANHKQKKYKGTVIQEGQLVTGQDVLAKELKMTRRQIRTSLNKLKMTNEVTIKTSSKGSLIQVVNWSRYQVVTSDMTKESPTDVQQVTTNKKEKKEKKNINERIQDFKESLEPYVDQYGQEMVKEFFLYWSESNQSGTKFRKELQKTWSVGRRLHTWSSNNFNNTYKPKQSETVQEREERLKESKQN
jgi:hypothetical protein